jgi:hypothetical protein
MKPKREKRLKNKLTTEVSVKVVSAHIKEPPPPPNKIFEGYKNDRKKNTKKDKK